MIVCAVRSFPITMIYSKVFFETYVNNSVITAPTIDVNNALNIGTTTNNFLQYNSFSDGNYPRIYTIITL